MINSAGHQAPAAGSTIIRNPLDMAGSGNTPCCLRFPGGKLVCHDTSNGSTGHGSTGSNNELPSTETLRFFLFFSHFSPSFF
jgi:hypothetical protein